MDTFFETLPWQREKAIKALQTAKEMEAKKVAKGAKYVQVDAKTWKLIGEGGV